MRDVPLAILPRSYLLLVGTFRVALVDPWTQRFRVAWRPTLAFFEERYRIMRQLEEAQLLRGFEVDERRVRLRLGDVQHQLAFANDRLETSALRPDADLARLKTGVKCVWDALAPSGVRRPTMQLQWLEPLELSYDDARRHAADQLLSLPEEARHKDFAISLDGESADGAVRSHVEFGVVEAAEIGPRLAGGRRAPDRGDPPASIWPIETLPQVALFCDQTWIFDRGMESVNDMTGIWDDAKKRGEQLMRSIHERLLGDLG